MPQEIQSFPSDKTIQGKRLVDTHLSSAAIRDSWDEKIKQQALFSARTTSKSYLDMVRKTLASIATGQSTPQASEMNLKAALQNLGYRPETGFPDSKTGKVPPANPGSIRDLSSSQRIRLIIDTNVKQARSLGQIAASESPAMLMTSPAWKLTRTGARKKPRGDWYKRWEAAGNSVGWYGASRKQFIALKTSPIWKAIGEGAGGYGDTIGTPYPPFAFGSGMAWVGVDWEDWEELCEKEGIPSHLDDITAKAKALKRASTSPSSEQEKDIHPISAERKEQTATGVRKEYSYMPDYSSRQNADRKIDATLEEMRAEMAEVEKMAKEVSAASKKCESFIAENDDIADEILPSVAKMSKYASSIASASKKIVTYYGRVSNYGTSIGNTPPPKNDLQQRNYDAMMAAAEKKADDAMKMARAAFSSARMNRDAALLTARRIVRM